MYDCGYNFVRNILEILLFYEVLKKILEGFVRKYLRLLLTEWISSNELQKFITHNQLYLTINGAKLVTNDGFCE